MVNTIKRLARIVTELGGTPYEVAQSGGLLSAAQFLELHVENGEEASKVKAVTEVYVHFEDRRESDRVFLYSDSMQVAGDLRKEGNIEDGKLVIPYEKLKALAAKGYKCIYQRRPDGHNGRAFAHYHAAFGENKTMLPFKMWDSSAVFMGNGHNRALLIETDFGPVFVMPDIHGVRESLRVIHAENRIRETYNPRFCIERIRIKKKKGELSQAYSRLQQQIGYIIAHYPKVYEQVWQKSKGQMPEGTKVSVGICMDYCRTYAVCCLPDGTMRKIPNGEIHYFGGFTGFTEGNSSGEKLCVLVKNIISSAEAIYKVTVDKIYITVMENALSSSQVLGGSLIQENGLPQIEYVDYYTAVMSAYRNAESVKCMEEGDVALLYEFGESLLAPTLVKKGKDNTYEVLGREAEPYPEDSIYDEDEDFSHVYQNTFQDVYEDEFGNPMVPGLREVMWSDMDHFMLDAGLRVLGIDNRKPGNKKALEKMRNDWLRIKRQLLRNNNAIIMFCNVYFSISMDYPIGRLEKCYAPILRNSDRALDVLFEKASVSKEQVAAVVLAGENCEYPFVQRYLEKYTGKIPEMVNMPEFVAARGAVLYEKM